MTTYGLSSTGFTNKQQAQIISEIQVALQQALGSNINLLPQAVFGQIVNIYSEREALVWQLAEAVYNSQYPAGAEGTSVDNILALNGLKRLPASATVTAPTNTAGVPGLVLFGTPGTVVPQGSIISVNGNATVQFTLDAAVTIAAAVNAVQLISFYGGVPTTGSFTLTIKDPFGTTLTTPPIPYNALAAATQLTAATPPTSGNYALYLDGALAGSFAYNASAATVQAGIVALSGYTGTVVTGQVSTGLQTITWPAGYNPLVSIGAVYLVFSANPTGGTFSLTLDGNLLTGLAYNITAATLQAGIRALAGGFYDQAYVTGSATSASGFQLIFGIHDQAVAVVVTAQPTGATISVGSTSSLNQTTVAVNSAQAAIDTLYDLDAGNRPYTDVAVSGSISSSLLTVAFGTYGPQTGQPASGSQAQETFQVATDSLEAGTTVINVNATTSQAGSPAQASGSATCTVTGPNFVPAGFLSVIGSPVGGWTGVTNPLDCITGANIESDTAALARRLLRLSENANGPVQSIAEKVAAVAGVAQAQGFENTSLAADQIITFNAVPTSGSFELVFTGPFATPETTAGIPWNALDKVQQIKFTATPTSGTYTLSLGAQTTAPIAFNASAGTVQAALHLLAGYSTASVTGAANAVTGFLVSFGISTQLTLAVDNTLLVGAVASVVGSVQSAINSLVSYGLATVSGTYSVGFRISFNGSAGGQPQLLVQPAGVTLSNGSAVTPTIAFGRPGKSFEIVVDDNNGEAQNSLIAAAIYGAKPAGMQSYGTTTVDVSDSQGNVYPISFSRPTQVPIYIVIALQTDLTTNPTPTFNPASVLTIQQDLVTIGAAFPVGGTIIGQGSNGLIGAFNAVPGITSYTMYFGTAPNPSSSANIELQSEQVAQFESFLISISYT